MHDNIELLSLELLKDERKLKEIDLWCRVFNWPNGWHYDLDIIWILRHIEKIGLPKGSTILDAGAGLGMLQFILSSRGYNVISLDFTRRNIPKYSRGIFRIELNQEDIGDYQHEYMDWMTYGHKKTKKVNIKGRFKTLLNFLRIATKDADHAKYIARHRLLQIYNPYYHGELKRPHHHFGKITFLRGTFNNIPVMDNQVDMLVSLSAFEHNTYKDMPGSVIEFSRIVKPGGFILVTTSAAEKKDWYFEGPKAWNLTQETLERWFDIRKSTPFEYRSYMNRLRKSHVLSSRISGYYKFSSRGALPYGRLDQAKYAPVGIVKRKL